MENNLQTQTVYYDRKVNPGLIGIKEYMLAKQISFTYLWMVLGLLATALTSVLVYQNPELQHLIFGSKPIFYSLLAAQLFAVCIFPLVVETCRAFTAFVLYFIYAVLVGITLSVIFLTFQLPSIVTILVCTSFSFLGLSGYGLLTKRNLQGIGSFCMAGLFGMVGLLLVFFLFPSTNTESMSLTWSAIGVIVFSGLIAYDSQKLKEMLISSEYTGSPEAGTINAALFLYLDFLNLFLSLLRIFGSKK